MDNDIYTSDDLIKKANKDALLAARMEYNSKIATFVGESADRLAFAKDQIDQIIAEAAESFGADPAYVGRHLNDVIAAEIKTAENDNTRTLEKGLGVDGERVKEDLTNAGDAFNPFKDNKSSDKDTSEKGLGVSGEKGEEAVSEVETISVEFSDNEGENKDVAEGFAGGPETPDSEVKDPSEPALDETDELVHSDIDYHQGPVLEEGLRGPSAGGKGVKHDLKEDTFKWTKVQDRIVTEAANCCGPDCQNCNCGGACGTDCKCRTSKKKV